MADAPPAGYPMGPVMAERPRMVTGAPSVANARTDYERATDNLRNLYQPVENTNGRFAGGGSSALQLAGQAARSGSLGQAAGAGIVGLLAGLFDKKTDERLARPGQIQQAQAQVGVESAIKDRDLKRRETETDIDYKRAQAEYYRNVKPQQASATERRRTRQDVRADLKLHPHPFDLNDPADLEFLNRAESAGVFIDTDEWGYNEKAPRTIDVLAADGVTVNKLQWDGQEWEPVTHGEQPIVAKRVQRINTDTGMTEAGERSDADRDATRSMGRERFVETSRRNAVTEGQAERRIQQGGARSGSTRGGANPTDARRTRAASAIGKLNTLLGKLDMARTDRARNAARQQIERQSSLINSEFGDLTQDDASGWRTSLKPRATSSATPTGGARYAGQRFSSSRLGDIQQRLGASSPEEARRIIEANGGKVID